MGEADSFLSGHGFSRAAKSQAGKAALAAEFMSVPKRRIRQAGTYFVTSRTGQSRPVLAQKTAGYTPGSTHHLRG